jgi:hypothetical protein
VFFYNSIWLPSWKIHISVTALASNVQPNRRSAANMLLLIIQHQYIGAANHLAPMCWCCKYEKNPQNFVLCVIIGVANIAVPCLIKILTLFAIFDHELAPILF